MKPPKLIKVLPVANELGEGVIWDTKRQCIWWTDIADHTLYSYSIDQDNLQQWPTPKRITCLALVAEKDYLLVAFEDGIAYLQTDTGLIEYLHKIEQHQSHTRLNDGRCDRQGRFWVGSMREGSSKNEIGALYCLDKDLNCTQKVSDILISNSLCWSPDSKYMYHADTPSRTISRYRFDKENAQVLDKISFIETPASCYPDGSTIDANGFLWNAQWGGSQVVRYDPNGNVDCVIPLPVTQPTCVAIGGPQMNLLFVTTAKQGLSEEKLNAYPGSGDLYIFETSIKGIQESEFKPNKEPKNFV